MQYTTEIVGATGPISDALGVLEASNRAGTPRRLIEDPGRTHGREFRRIAATCPCTMGRTDRRFARGDHRRGGEQGDRRQQQRQSEFDIVMVGFALVVVAVLEAVIVLSRRVVRPLAQLGAAITRIAAGDRSVPLTIRSCPREITEMVTAVETLRQAALIADAASMRQRTAARQRLAMLAAGSGHRSERARAGASAGTRCGAVVGRDR